MNKKERNIWYDEEDDLYRVVFGFQNKKDQKVFPTLELALKYRDNVWKTMTEEKIKAARNKIREKEKSEFEKNDVYPLNILSYADINIDDISPNIVFALYTEEGMDNALANYAEDKGSTRFINFINLYFKERKTFEEIARINSISRQRVRQIIFCQLKRFKFYLYSFDKIKKEEEKELLINQRQELIKTIKEKGIVNESIKNEVNQILNQCYDLKIENLNLSVRTYLVLKRAGFENLIELTDYTEDHIFKLRNMDRSSLKELKEKMREHGLEFKTLEE